jgi:hypothetical protein
MHSSVCAGHVAGPPPMHTPFQHSPWMQGLTSHSAPLGALTVVQLRLLHSEMLISLQALRHPAGECKGRTEEAGLHEDTHKQLSDHISALEQLRLLHSEMLISLQALRHPAGECKGRTEEAGLHEDTDMCSNHTTKLLWSSCASCTLRCSRPCRQCATLQVNVKDEQKKQRYLKTQIGSSKTTYLL